uniref:Uncharacterized protein n=1 Tax=Anguilla anguilla TaxID=7936 RepID=A0A0E9V3Y3_ANGAN
MTAQWYKQLNVQCMVKYPFRAIFCPYQ